ncbi:MAG: VOC family protein [Prevotellaceae bacterium]|jgi:catechol 2,3-dioxygenase-like lactoylglutathione lyase family enzyme|nr:VOC family protein [Prevotellaceae bacterium]
MKLEHVALNVENPVEMAQWYCDNLGMTIVANIATEPFTHFIADESGRIMIEIYRNPVDEIPDYRAMNPLLLHLAFVSANPAADSDRLTEKGATMESDTVLPDGTHLVMLRDPWGLAFQLCKRAKSLLLEKEK